MSSCSATRKTPKFSEPQWFTRSTKKVNEWICTICAPEDHASGQSDLRPSMSAKAALHHERTSAEHARRVSKLDIWSPTDDLSDCGEEGEVALTAEELKKREKPTWVDSVWDMVPFWIDGLEAAERGEVVRMEEFLERTEEAAWGNRRVWGYAYSADGWNGNGDGWHDDESLGWGGERWKCDEGKRTESETLKGTKRTKDVAYVGPSTTYAFVEDIARQGGADSARRRRMHQFFELSAEEKIKKIEELIRDVRVH